MTNTDMQDSLKEFAFTEELLLSTWRNNTAHNTNAITEGDNF